MKQLLDGVGKFYLVSYGIERYLRGEFEALRLLNLLKTTYSMLFETNKLQEDGSFYLSFKKISSLTGLTRRKFEKARKVLLEKDLISIEVKNKDDEKEKYRIQFFKINVEKYNQIVLQDNGIKLEDIEDVEDVKETQIIEVPELPKQKKSDDIALATKLWNEKIADKYMLIKKIQGITGTREKNFRTRLKESKLSVEEFFDNLEKHIAASDFLQGLNQRGWVVEFSWAMKPENYLKIVEDTWKNITREDRKKAIDEAIFRDWKD